LDNIQSAIPIVSGFREDGELALLSQTQYHHLTTRELQSIIDRINTCCIHKSRAGRETKDTNDPKNLRGCMTLFVRRARRQYLRGI
jgi:hypothetical protein